MREPEEYLKLRGMRWRPCAVKGDNSPFLERLGEATTVTTKDQMLIAIQELPADATITDAMEQLYLLYKIERGLSEADSGQKVSQEEARQRMERWLK